MISLSRQFLFFLLATVVVKAFRTRTIRVGFAGNSVFDPATTTADVGDLVVFEFFPTNHSVARGEYAESKACGSSGCNPCVPYELIHPGQEGFHSNNFLTQTTTNKDIPTFNITIGDNRPIWFYCSALDSCNPNGMIGVINPAKGQSVDTQKSAAISANYQLIPGQPWPAEGSGPNSQATRKSKVSRVSGRTVAGIVIGILLAVALIIACVFFMWRARQKNTSKNPGGDSMSVARTDVEEQSVPVPPRYEPSSISSPRSLESPAPPLRPKRSVLQTFYRYPIVEKQLTAPEGHPAYRTYSTQNDGIELQKDGDLGRTSE